jgi:hypothetical protein
MHVYVYCLDTASLYHTTESIVHNVLEIDYQLNYYHKAIPLVLKQILRDQFSSSNS